MLGKKSHIAILTALLLAATACADRTPVIEPSTDKSEQMKENMINANHVVIKSEATQIDGYIARRGWAVEPLPSGACYWVYTQGTGATIEPNDRVAVTYRLESLDGTPFYTHQVDTLVVGHLDATAALDDLLQHLTYGSQAWLIAPSNSAYGVVGDGDRVPTRTVLVYKVTNIKRL